MYLAVTGCTNLNNSVGGLTTNVLNIWWNAWKHANITFGNLKNNIKLILLLIWSKQVWFLVTLRYIFKMWQAFKLIIQLFVNFLILLPLILLLLMKLMPLRYMLIYIHALNEIAISN
jgi:hypothetical protein